MTKQEIQQMREAICNEYHVPVDMVFPKTPVRISEESAKAAKALLKIYKKRYKEAKRRLNQQEEVMKTSPADTAQNAIPTTKHDNTLNFMHVIITHLRTATIHITATHFR